MHGFPLKELPPEIIDQMREAIARENAKPMDPDHEGRFTAPMHHLKREEHGPGLDLVCMQENGNIMLDFGAPVQVLGMTIDDTKALITMLLDTMKYAMVADIVKEHDKAKAN